ncbi:MAG: hypothetical protein JWO94_2729 [Verrucomicrobiaceae bacterium]|nr:hypothetical protein [Verrucomicrobiaceae bacterium]
METNRDFLDAATSVSQPPAPSATATGCLAHRGDGLQKRRPGTLYRLFMHTPLMEPYRHLLRPLLRWAWKPHFAILGGLELVNLKPPSTFALVMSIILGPLVFVMLLPLVLILVPVAMVVGVLAVLAACLQCEADTQGPHSMALHVLD